MVWVFLVLQVFGIVYMRYLAGVTTQNLIKIANALSQQNQRTQQLVKRS